MAGTYQCSWLCQIRQRANESTSQRANDVQPYRTYRDFLRPYHIEDANDSRVTSYDPYSIPGSNVCCVLCRSASLDATTRSQSTAHSSQYTVHSPQSKALSQAHPIARRGNLYAGIRMQSLPGSTRTIHSLRRRHPARIVVSLPANRTQHPGAAIHNATSCSPILGCIVYRLPCRSRSRSKFEVEAELARPVYGVRCTVTGQAVDLALRYVEECAGYWAMSTAADVCILGMRIGP